MSSVAALSPISQTVYSNTDNCAATLDFSDNSGYYIKSACFAGPGTLSEVNAMCTNLGMQLFIMDPASIAQELLTFIDTNFDSDKVAYVANTAGTCSSISNQGNGYVINAGVCSGNEFLLSVCEYLKEGKLEQFMKRFNN